ncbi:serine/threonine protein kinase [Actinokineospora alba]|uniref:non-specific serine/threonine protein kinase n=1 Tax=Actinokineospora alba TaxID=504798 RepID=A0A1H0SEW4_9PSEU|nr:serine/threonine-protein kinase [Actinokineospora alba]TDP66633.1 serine/threonine-protein kinase [Actinokineospora alba]SDI53422.1 serine/threonine protein kinase [Actinokineospora alba]SDP39716.1 serine/threonine protein kinase [Actinokineospora alba]
MSEDLTGRRLGHYRIDGVLGKGGMSVMYRATDVRLGRKVALKVIAEHLTEDPEFRERFVDEARNTSAIDHSNVVPLYDFGEVDGLLYIAMRLVEGADMASLVKDGPMAPQRAISLLSQVAEALDNLHERGLVHLDVKPANVLVTSRESATEHVYVADFGLTRRGATGHRTRGGDFLGSPTYAAPEHLRGEPVDGRTDAYSLACVLFACLSGRPPFQGQVSEVIQGHLNREAPRLTEFAPGLPPAIDDVVRRGMSKQPGQRYASCRELIAAARQALSAPARPAPQQQQRPVQQQTFQQFPTPPRQPQQSSHAEPVRLRPPVPAGAAAFGKERGGNRWIAPVLVGLVAIGLIIGAIVVLSPKESGPGGGGTSTTGPSIPVGPGESGSPSGSSKPTTRKTLPSISLVAPPSN